MHTASRLAPTLALVALAVVGSSGTAHAAETTTPLTGRVLQINESNGSDITGQLAQRGLSVGTEVAISYTVDDTVQADAAMQVSSIYFDAVVSISIGGGTYEARYDRAPADVRESNVSVANDRDGGIGPTDTYSVRGNGADTGNIVAPGTQGAPVVISVTFSDTTAAAISDEGVVQDVGAFPPNIAAITVVGANGSIVISLEAGAGGGDFGRCVQGQLGAAAKLAGSALKCSAKQAAQPADKDPQGLAAAACVAKARGKYVKKFGAVVQSATKKGGACRLEAGAAGPTADGLLLDLSNFVVTILAGGDPAQKADRVLRSKLLKASAAQAAKDLAAYGKDAKKPNAGKLQKQLEASRAKAVKAIDKALAKAAKKGIIAAELTGTSVAAAVRTVVETHVGAVAP